MKIYQVFLGDNFTSNMCETIQDTRIYASLDMAKERCEVQLNSMRTRLDLGKPGLIEWCHPDNGDPSILLGDYSEATFVCLIKVIDTDGLDIDPY